MTATDVDSARQDINAAIDQLGDIGADVFDLDIPAESLDRIEGNLKTLRGHLADAVNSLNRIGDPK